MTERKSFSEWEATDAAAFVGKNEGCRLTAYKCPAGVWTIGFGSTRMNGRAVRAGDKITQAQADILLFSDLERFKAAVAKSVSVPVSKGEFIALMDFVYNIGAAAFKKSQLLRLLNEGKRMNAAYEFLRWRYAGGVESRGLLLRREREKEQFLA